MSKKKFINFNERAYKFIRASAINQLIDAIVELVTNCDDAYDKSKIKEKKIQISIDYKGKMKVRDHATGLYGDEMEKCFLQVGNYTSDKDNRGFFSRGAKDITALGDVTFECIKNKKYSKVSLDKNARGSLDINNINVKPEIRKSLRIPDNGTLVTLKINDGVYIPSPTEFLNIFNKHVSLRNILSNKNSKCTISFRNGKEFEFNNKEFKFNYKFPQGDVLLYLTYSLPSYPKADAFFTISRSEKQLYDNKNKKYCDWGILMTSNKVIHDITELNPQFKFNPHMKTIYGIIHSTYINKLLIDYDKKGPTKLNPFPILDPSRVGGINFNHPFMKELIKIPTDRLNLILQDLEAVDENEYIFYNDELMDIVDKLNIAGDKLLKSNELIKYVENKNSNLIKGIESDRGKYVTVEKNFLQDLNKTKRVNVNPKKDKKKAQPYKDPMTKLFDIIGVGNEGNAPTDELDQAQLFKEFDNSVMNNVEKEEKKIFVYNKIEGQKDDGLKEDFETQNYQHLKKQNMFVIKFIQSSQNRKYEIYQSGQKIILKINVSFPILKRYFNSDNDFSQEFETSKLEAVMLLHEILTEALTRIQLISYINRDFIKLNADSSLNNFEELFKNYDSYKNNIDISVDKVIQNIINNERKKIKKLIKNDKQEILDPIIESDDEDFNEGLKDIKKLDNPSNIIKTLGFEEEKIVNTNNNDTDYLILQEKCDKLQKENEKLKSENDFYKKENKEIKTDIFELRDILLDEKENRVIKRFKRMEKYIDFNFKNFEDEKDFCNYYKITHYYLSPALKGREKKLIELGLKSSFNLNDNVLFYGMYRDCDLQAVRDHTGKKFIYWDDNDCNVNYENRRNNLMEISKLADFNICGTMIVEKYLQIVDVKYNKMKLY